MEVQCSNENCKYSSFEQMPLNNKPPPLPIYCPVCEKRKYHSEICLYNDSKHFSICTKSKLKNRNTQIVKYTFGITTDIFINSKEIDLENSKIIGSGSYANVKISK